MARLSQCLGRTLCDLCMDMPIDVRTYADRDTWACMWRGVLRRRTDMWVRRHERRTSMQTGTHVLDMVADPHMSIHMPVHVSTHVSPHMSTHMSSTWPQTCL